MIWTSLDADKPRDGESEDKSNKSMSPTLLI
jgi:hypothetical protein